MHSKPDEYTNNNGIKDSSITGESLTNIYKDAIKYAPSKIVGTLINLLMVSIYTNLLSPKEYGLYMVSTAVISFLAIIFSDWIGVSALRFFKENFKRDNIESYFSTILVLLISNLLIMYLAGFLFFKPIEKFFQIPSNYLFFVMVLIIPIAIRALLFQILRAQIKPLTYTFSVIINQLLTVGTAIFLINQFHLGAIALLIGMGVSIVLIDIIMIFQTKYHKSVDREKIEFNILKGLYKYGAPLALASFGMWTITQSNRFILQHFNGSAYNGQLGVGYNLTFSIMMPLFSIISMAAIPRLFSKYESGIDVRPIISKLIEIYFVVFVPITFILCIYPKEIVSIFANSKFSDAFILIPFLALSAFCLGLTEITTAQYHIAKKTSIDMYIRIFSGLSGILFNIILIPEFGLLGIGIAAILSNFLYLILSIVIKIKNLVWEIPYKSVIKSSIILLLCLGISILLRSFFNPLNGLYFVLHTSVIISIYTILIKKSSFLK